MRVVINLAGVGLFVALIVLCVATIVHEAS